MSKHNISHLFSSRLCREYPGRPAIVGGGAGCTYEDMLTERITDAYSAAGDIRVRITLMPEWLRISFSDNGAEYFIDKRRDTSMSAVIILKAVSNFHTDYPDGKPVYCMDFLYEQDINIQEFLMKSKGEE